MESLPTTLWLDKIKGTENTEHHSKALISLFAARTQGLTDPGRDLQVTQVKTLNTTKPLF